MTKRSANATLSPFSLSLGQGVFADHAKVVVEQLAYSGAENPETHAATASGNTGWGTSGSEPSAHAITIGGSLVEVYSFFTYVDPDAQNLLCSSRVTSGGSSTYEVTITVGAGSVVNTHAATGLESDTVATSSTGTGSQLVTIEVQRTAGSAEGVLEAWSIRAVPIADGDLPSPVAE